MILDAPATAADVAPAELTVRRRQVMPSVAFSLPGTMSRKCLGETGEQLRTNTGYDSAPSFVPLYSLKSSSFMSNHFRASQHMC